MSGFNYSKWDKIELSDDESDLHPNIDKESWFRMKHRTRIEREQREDVEIKNSEQLNSQHQARINIIKARLSGIQSGAEDDDAQFEDVDALQVECKELEDQIKSRNQRIAEIREKRAWNIDNICTVKEEKTIVSSSTSASLKADDFKPTGRTEAALAPKTEIKPSATSDNSATSKSSTTPSSTTPSTSTAPTTKSASSAKQSGSSSSAIGPSPKTEPAREKFAVISYNDYVLGHEDILETYSEIRDLEATKDYLFKHCDILLHEHAQSYMLLSSLEDEMNGKKQRMKLVCRQSQILSHITELATSLSRDPRDMVIPFFRRIQEPEYIGAFLKAVEDFVKRIQARAVDKRKEMDAEREEEVPLGPGGLNPLEVLESLPQSLRSAFDDQDIERLQSVLASMPPPEAKKWMKMCVDSGLWVPKDQSIFEDGDEGDEGGEGVDEIDA